MRNKFRIERILKELGDLWIELPDLRLGQFLANLGSERLYYMEDDDLIKESKEFYSNNNKKENII